MGMKNVSGIRKVVRGNKPHWLIDFRYTDQNGVRQRFRRDASVQMYAAALAEADRLMRKAAACGVVEEVVLPKKRPASMTYRVFVEGMYESLYMPRFRPATARRYRELHAQRVMAFFGTKELRAIGPGDYRTFAAMLRTDGVNTKGPINLARSVLRAACECGYIDQVPECPRGLIGTSRKVPDAPSSDDVSVMLTAPGWLGTAIALGALAGLRMGEVRAMEVRDVDFDRRRVLVRRAMSEDSSLTPKSDHEREVPLSAALEAHLREAVKDKLPRAPDRRRRGGEHPPSAAGAPPVQAVSPEPWLEGALLPLPPPLLHLGADAEGGGSRSGTRPRGSLEARDDPALRPRRDGRPSGGHRKARKVA